MEGEEESNAITHISDIRINNQNDSHPVCSVCKMQCFGDKILQNEELSFGHYSLNENIETPDKETANMLSPLKEIVEESKKKEDMMAFPFHDSTPVK